MKFPSYNTFLKMIPAQWRALIEQSIPQEYYRELHGFLRSEYSGGIIYPPAGKIFRALDLTPPDLIRAVIIGQDPYHGKDEADGLAFSASGCRRLPPSLKNIFAEIESDTGITLSRRGDLTPWAEQGVLLLNTMLTVREDTPGSHRKTSSAINPGWEIFTDAVIRAISSDLTHIVFLLWGNHAIEKAGLIDGSKHLVLTASHPSPFSVKKSFKGCRHFSRANEYLRLNNRKTVDWSC